MHKNNKMDGEEMTKWLALIIVGTIGGTLIANVIWSNLREKGIVKEV